MDTLSAQRRSLADPLGVPAQLLAAAAGGVRIDLAHPLTDAALVWPADGQRW